MSIIEALVIIFFVIIICGFVCLIQLINSIRRRDELFSFFWIMASSIELIFFMFLLSAIVSTITYESAIGRPCDDGLKNIKTGETCQVVHQEPAGDDKFLVMIKTEDDYFSFFSSTLLPEPSFVINSNREPVAITATTTNQEGE